MNYNNIFNPSSIEHSKIEFGKPQIVDNKYLIINLWYKNDDVYGNFFMQIFKVPILKTSNNLVCELALDLTMYPEKQFLEELDSYAAKYIKKYGLIKKYNLKNIEYKSISGNNQCNFVLTENMDALLFDNKKNLVSYKEYIKKLEKNNYISVIFEVNSIIINITNNSIFINIIPKQIKLHNDKFYIPKVIQLDKYAFIDCDGDELVSNNDLNDSCSVSISVATNQQPTQNAPKQEIKEELAQAQEIKEERAQEIKKEPELKQERAQEPKPEFKQEQTTATPQQDRENKFVKSIEGHAASDICIDDDDLISSIMTVGNTKKSPALIVAQEEVKTLKIKKQPGRKKKT